MSILRQRPLGQLVAEQPLDGRLIETRLVFRRQNPGAMIPTDALALKFDLEIWGFPEGVDVGQSLGMSQAVKSWLPVLAVDLGLAVLKPMIWESGMKRKASLLGGYMRFVFDGSLAGASIHKITSLSNHRLLEIAARPDVELLRLPR